MENLAAILFSLSPTSFPAQLITAYAQKYKFCLLNCIFRAVLGLEGNCTGCRVPHLPLLGAPPNIVSPIIHYLYGCGIIGDNS